MITYNSWNEMLNERDKIHETYIRAWNHHTLWEVIYYSKWDDDTYIGYGGAVALTPEELVEGLKKRGYDTSKIDICTYKED